MLCGRYAAQDGSEKDVALPKDTIGEVRAVERVVGKFPVVVFLNSVTVWIGNLEWIERSM